MAYPTSNTGSFWRWSMGYGHHGNPNVMAADWSPSPNRPVLFEWNSLLQRSRRVQWIGGKFYWFMPHIFYGKTRGFRWRCSPNPLKCSYLLTDYPPLFPSTNHILCWKDWNVHIFQAKIKSPAIWCPFGKNSCLGRWLVYHRHHHLPIVTRALLHPSFFINQPMGIWDINGL